jgi:hypothetical protein
MSYEPGSSLSNVNVAAVWFGEIVTDFGPSTRVRRSSSPFGS